MTSLIDSDQEETTFVDYCKSVSFFQLNKSLNSFSNEQLQQALEIIKPNLLKGWDYVEKDLFADDVSNYETISKKQEFIKELAKRIMLDEKRSLQFVLHYISLAAAEGSDVSEFDDALMLEIVSFYFRERLEIINVTASIFRKANFLDEEPSDDRQSIYHKTAQWLIEHGIMDICLTMIKNSVDLDSVSDTYKHRVSDTDERGIISPSMEENIDILKKQKLKEIVTVLELVYAIFYAGHSCSRREFDILMKEYFFPIYYGKLYLQWTTGDEFRAIVRRITSLCILITKRILNPGELVNNNSSIIQDGEITEYVLQIENCLEKGEEYAAAVKILWGCYIRFNTSPQFRNIPENKQMMEHLVADGILCKTNVLKYFISLFDHSHPQYSYHRSSENLYAYQADVESAVWCTLRLLPIEHFEFLISDILKCLEFAFLKNINLQSRFFSDFVKAERESHSKNTGRHDNSDEAKTKLISDPYLKLYKFVQSLFPFRTHLSQFLSLMIFDERSAEYAVEKIKDVGRFCFSIELNEELRDPIPDSGYSIIHLKDIMRESSYVEPYTQTYISSNTNLAQYNQFSSRKRIVVGMRWNHSGWEILAAHFRTFINQSYLPSIHDSEEELIRLRDSITLLFKLLQYGSSRAIIEIENTFSGTMKVNFPVSTIRHPIFGKTLFSAFVSLTRSLEARRSAFQQSILSIVLKCFRFFAKQEPVLMAETLKRLCFDVYSNIIHIECTSGHYPCVIQLLKLISILANNHPSPRNNLLEIVSFISSNIFSIHDSWRFLQLSQKWSIARECLKIFNTICADGFWRNSSRDNTSAFIFSLYTNGSFYQSLFSILGFGHQLFRKLLEEDMLDDASLVQQMIIEALRVHKALLQIRFTEYTLSSNQYIITPFEQILITKLVGSKDVPLIATLFDYIDTRHPTDVNILAFKCINLIARLTQHYYPRPPSLIGYLNRTSSEANTVMNKCMLKLVQDATHPDLRRCILDLIATSIDHQRGLADKLLLGIRSCEDEDKTEVETEKNVLKCGCMKYVLLQLKQFLNYKKSGHYDPVQSKTLLSCIKILQSVLVGGHYEQIVTALYKDYQTLWKILIQICNMAIEEKTISIDDQSVTIERLTEDYHHIQSVSTIIAIVAVELYNLNRRVKNDEDWTHLSPLFEQDLQSILFLLARKITRYILAVINDQIIFKKLEEACQKYTAKFQQFNLMDYTITSRLQGDSLFDTCRMKRWEKSGCEEIISICNVLNIRHQVCESSLTLLRAIRSTVSVFNTPAVQPLSRKIQESLIEFSLHGLRMGTLTPSPYTKEQYDNVPFENICIFYPVQPQFLQMANEIHSILSELLLSIAKGVRRDTGDEEEFDFVMLTEDNWSLLAYALDSQIHVGNWKITRNMLAFILYTLITQNETEKAMLPDIWRAISPVILKISEFNENSVECCELALSILQVFLPKYFSIQNIQFFCQQLSIGLAHFSQGSSHQFTYRLLLILQGIAGTKRGCSILLQNFVIEKLANATYIHMNNLYENGKRSTWHLIWCQEIQLLTHMFNTANSSDQEGVVSSELSSLSQEILDKICDFCISHKEHISRILVQTLTQDTVQLASLIEMESLSMLIFVLARTGKLFWNKPLFENAISCMTQYHFFIDRQKIFLSKIHPISDDEVALYSQEHAREVNRTSLIETEKKGRQHLTWSGLVVICLLGSFRNILSSIRCMTQIPNEVGIELKEILQSTLSEYTLRANMIPILRSCTDILVRVYRNVQPPDPESKVQKSYNERSARKITTLSLSAMQEALLTIAFHILNPKFNRTQNYEGPTRKTPVEKELTLTIESVRKEIYSLQHMHVVKEDTFEEVKSLLQVIYENFCS